MSASPLTYVFSKPRLEFLLVNGIIIFPPYFCTCCATYTRKSHHVDLIMVRSLIVAALAGAVAATLLLVILGNTGPLANVLLRIGVRYSRANH